MAEDESAFALVAAAVEHLGSELSREELLARVVGLASGTIASVDHASVTLGGGQGWTTPAASDPVALEVDALQYELDQGPCVEAARSGQVLHVPDVTAEERWPAFASRLAGRRAEQVPVRSMMALPLRAGSEVTGSLNLSSARARAFTGTDPAAAAVLATVVGLALAAADARERAAASRAQVDGFGAALAHDLRSGTTVLLGAHALLEDRRGLLDAAGREALDLLDDELTRQCGLLEDLLDLARARAEHLPVEPVLLVPVVRDAVRRHRGHVRVELAPGAAFARVGLHAAQVRRILSNLLDNADRHAGGATAVVVGRTADHGWVAVQDAGPGVPPERRDGVFTPFGAMSSSGEHLGLALCREHARAVGGDLVLDDRDGGGASFRLVLPLVAHGADGAAAPAS